MTHHIVPRRVYFTVFAILMVLTAITIAVATVDLGRWSVVIALTIAVTKALLVVLFFMHVKYSSHLTKVMVAAGVFWLVILISLTASDYLSRGWLPAPKAW